MTREIKFRAWDGHKMDYEVTIYNGRFIDCGDADEDIFNKWHDPADQLAIMQFTGLKDKNGKEVFEGDIFCVADNRLYEVRWVDKQQVQSGGYETYGACFVLWISDELFFPFDEFAFAHGEVIGNVYENPELLNS